MCRWGRITTSRQPQARPGLATNSSPSPRTGSQLYPISATSAVSGHCAVSATSARRSEPHAIGPDLYAFSTQPHSPLRGCHATGRQIPHWRGPKQRETSDGERAPSSHFNLFACLDFPWLVHLAYGDAKGSTRCSVNGKRKMWSKSCPRPDFVDHRSGVGLSNGNT